MAYNELIKEKNIARSNSRPGKPTDNPVNESLNGWIKEELYMDFKIGECDSRGEMISVIDRYIVFYNSQRPCYAIGYDIPDHYYQRFINGELEKRETFAKRDLSPEPKFVRKRKEKKAVSFVNNKISEQEKT